MRELNEIIKNIKLELINYNNSKEFLISAVKKNFDKFDSLDKDILKVATNKTNFNSYYNFFIREVLLCSLSNNKYDMTKHSENILYFSIQYIKFKIIMLNDINEVIILNKDREISEIINNFSNLSILTILNELKDIY